MLLGASALLAGCGAAPRAPTPATHDDFRAIQRSEARIESNRLVATDPAVDCATACAAIGAVCEAARAIRAVADDTADLDAVARARRAEDVCLRVRAGGGARCECDG